MWLRQLVLLQYRDSNVTNDSKCTLDIVLRIDVVKKAFNKKNINLKHEFQIALRID